MNYASWLSSSGRTSICPRGSRTDSAYIRFPTREIHRQAPRQPATDEAEHFIRSGLRRLDRLPRLGVRVRAGRAATPAARECRLTLVESLRSLSIPKSCHVGREALPSEERVRVFIEGPDLQRHKTDADFAGGGTYGVEQRAGDALSSMGRPHADMVQMDLVPGVAEWRFGQMNDLGIGVTGRLGSTSAMKTRLLGLASSLRATVAGNVSGPGGLKCSGRADACRLWTSVLRNESTSASASLARRTAPFIILSLVLALPRQC